MSTFQIWQAIQGQMGVCIEYASPARAKARSYQSYIKTAVQTRCGALFYQTSNLQSSSFLPGYAQLAKLQLWINLGRLHSTTRHNCADWCYYAKSSTLDKSCVCNISSHSQCTTSKPFPVFLSADDLTSYFTEKIEAITHELLQFTINQPISSPLFASILASFTSGRDHCPI